jgi:hypothetical protein
MSNLLQMFPKPHPQTAGRVIDGEAVLILADSSEVNVLNEVGSRIFALADGSRSVDEIAELIVTEYDVSVEQAIQDVTDFIRQMVDREVFILGDTREK